MREIKFRARDKEKKEWGFNKIGLSLRRIAGLGLTWFDENVEWVQYTGLKDKNGKEIYEGDIILDLQISPSLNNKRIIRNFIEDSFWLKRETDESERNIFEVIGNIYENPNEKM